MKRINSIHWIAILLLTGLALGIIQPCKTEAQDTPHFKTVTVLGSGHIRGNDQSAGRQKAIANGLVTAVGAVLTEILPPDKIAGHFQVINELILAHTDRFIQDYKVLTESIHDNTHRAMVQATVSMGRLQKTLGQAGIVLHDTEYPKTLLCITETQINEITPQYWWGGQSTFDLSATDIAMRQALETEGFSVITPGNTDQPLAYPLELTVPQATALAQQFGAEVVIIGRAVAKEAPNTLSDTIRSFRAIISIQAYRVNDGKSLAQADHSAVTAAEDEDSGGRQALTNAAALAGQDLARQVITAWQKRGKSKAQVAIIVEGTSGHIADFVQFRGALSGMSGVNSVQLKEMSTDAAVLSVDYQGTARALADALLRQNFNTFGINIYDVNQTLIRLKLVSR